MKRFIGNAFILSLFILGSPGCTTQIPKVVDVPVTASCPKAAIPPKPHLPIADLKPHSSADEVVKAYAASVALLEDYLDELIELLQAYGQ